MEYKKEKSKFKNNEFENKEFKNDEFINENELILELCKFKYADKNKLTDLTDKNLNYPYILGQLFYNRTAAMAYFALKSNGLLSKVNREFRNSVKAIYEYNLNKTNSFIYALGLFKKICKEFDFPYAFLKGAYLAELYPKGLRTSNDVDILIEPKNITKLSGILKRNGFLQGEIKNEVFAPAKREKIISSRINRGETVPFVKEVNLPGLKYLEIDVNFSLDFKPESGTEEKSIVSEFLNCTEPLILNQIHTLKKSYFLMHLCAHLYKEATVISWVNMGRDISLYKYCDIYLFLKEFLNEEFLTDTANDINRLKLNKECYYTLFNTKLLFNIKNNKLLDELLKKIKPENTEFMNCISDPENRKTYTYNMDYKNWVFCGKRKENIYEA